MSDTLAGEDVPVISRAFRFQWEEAQGCHVILYPEGMVKLNDAAGEILKSCDGRSTVTEIITGLQSRFPDAESLEDDVYKFLNTAYENKWIERRPS